MYSEINKNMKIMIVGDSKSGKTSLIDRFSADMYTDFPKGTYKHDALEYTSIGKIQVWEDQNAEYKKQSTYHSADALIILVDMTNKDGLINLDRFLKWKENHSNQEIIIVGTKEDDQNCILSKTDIEAYIKNNNLEYSITTCSAKNAKNINEIFEQIEQKVLQKRQIAYEKANPKSSEDLYKEAYNEFVSHINSFTNPEDSHKRNCSNILLNEITEAKKTEKMPAEELTSILKDASALIERPSEKGTQNFIEKSKTVEGKSSIRKRIAGAMIILAGVTLVGLSIALAAHTFGGSLLGVKVGINLILGGAAALSTISAVAGASSTCVFLSSKQKGLSKAMDSLAETQQISK